MTEFRYTDEEWSRIIEASGFAEPDLDRELLQDLASFLISEHSAINDAAAREARLDRIATIEKMAGLASCSRLKELLAKELQGARQRHGRTELKNASRPKFAREQMIREALLQLHRLTGEIPGHTSPEHKQPAGPAVEFVRCVVDPVFSQMTTKPGKPKEPLKGSSVDYILEKMRDDGSFDQAATAHAISERIARAFPEN